MYYAGQVGKRLPVPIFQSIEDFTIFGLLLLLERWLRTTAPAGALAPVPKPTGERTDVGVAAWSVPPPAGIVLGVGMVLWGIERYLDEHLWLGEPGHLGSALVQLAGVGLAVAGIVLLLARLGPLRRWRAGVPSAGGPTPSGEPEPGDEPGDEAGEPVAPGARGTDAAEASAGGQ